MNYQELKSLVEKNRSYRRFVEKETINKDLIKSWIDLARLSASARNFQTLKYKIVLEDQSDKVFPLLSWAGYLKDWSGPIEGERPNAYIIVMNDNNISENYFCDDGIASQSILLGSVSCGYAGCIIASFNKKKLKEIFDIPSHLYLIHVIALGKPKEKIVIEETKDGEIKYWRDEHQVHHVPKRPLDEIIY